MLRKLIALFCVIWVAGTVWFHVYDDLALFLYGEPAAKVMYAQVVEVNPVVEFLRRRYRGFSGTSGEYLVGEKTPMAEPMQPPVRTTPEEEVPPVFQRVEYQYQVGRGTWYRGSTIYVQDEVPIDLQNLEVRYDPTRPWVSRVEDHYEFWPYLTTLLALVLLVVMMLKQQEAVRKKGAAADPLRRFNLEFNQLKRDWERISPKTRDGMERQALAWSDDVLILRARDASRGLVALARLFIIYQDPADAGKSEASDATAVFRHDSEGWSATDVLEHDVPEKVRAKYPGYNVVHERIDQNRDILFEQLIERTRGKSVDVTVDRTPTDKPDRQDKS